MEGKFAEIKLGTENLVNKFGYTLSVVDHCNALQFKSYIKN